MTLVEVSIAALLFVLVAALFMGALVSVQTALGRQTEQSRANDEVRLAMQQIDREVRSGSLLYNPEDETLPFYSLRVYTQNNAVHRCIQWRIDDRQLIRRTWPPPPTAGTPPDPATVGPWRVVATGIVNRDVTPNLPAFTLVTPSGAAVGRTLQVVFLANDQFDRRPQQTARVQQSVTGRNTTRGAASVEEVCSPAPTG